MEKIPSSFFFSGLMCFTTQLSAKSIVKTDTLKYLI